MPSRGADAGDPAPSHSHGRERSTARSGWTTSRSPRCRGHCSTSLDGETCQLERGDREGREARTARPAPDRLDASTRAPGARGSGATARRPSRSTETRLHPRPLRACFSSHWSKKPACRGRRSTPSSTATSSTPTGRRERFAVEVDGWDYPRLPRRLRDRPGPPGGPEARRNRYRSESRPAASNANPTRSASAWHAPRPTAASHDLPCSRYAGTKACYSGLISRAPRRGGGGGRGPGSPGDLGR